MGGYISNTKRLSLVRNTEEGGVQGERFEQMGAVGWRVIF